MRRLTITDMLHGTPEGESFYWQAEAKAVASYAQRAGVVVTTKKLIALSVSSRELEDVLKITVVRQTDKPRAKRGRPSKQQ